MTVSRCDGGAASACIACCLPLLLACTPRSAAVHCQVLTPLTWLCNPATGNDNDDDDNDRRKFARLF